MKNSDLRVKEETSPSASEPTRPGRTYLPNVDIRETQDALWLWADMPGVDEKGVDVHLDGGMLHLTGQVAVDEYEALTPLYTEYNIGNFVRSFRINEEVDLDHIEAKLSHGVLQLRLPKAESARPRRVPVEVA
jgi:HSP20 family protein